MRHRSPEERLSRSTLFDAIADQYDRARPTYPPQVFDELWRLASLGQHPEIVEVGCGTGQATRDLVARGADVTGIEYGENMAAGALRRLGGSSHFNVIVSKFEAWDAGERRYDLVFASSAWHWIDPAIRYAKAAHVLRASGHIALLSSEHAFPDDYDRLFDSIQQAYADATGKKESWPPKPIEEMPDNRDDVLEGGHFKDVQVARVLWHFDRTADEFVDLLGTFSDHLAMEAERREELFARIHGIISASPGKRVRKHYLSTLRVAQRT